MPATSLSFLQQILVALILLIVVFFSLFRITESPPFGFDEGWAFHLATNISRVGESVTQFSPGRLEHSSIISVGYPLLYPLAFWFKLFGIGILQARLMMVLYLLGFVIASFTLLRRLYGNTIALSSLAILSTFPPFYTFGKEIIQAIEKYAASREARVRVFDNLGQRKYLSAMSYADAVVGNSSSGIIEAPFLKVPTVNIGERQRKRLKAESIIDCKENEYSIVLAIRKALSAGFKKNLDKIESVYGHGNTAIEVKNTLKKYKLKDILFKRFYDLQVPI